MKILLTSTSFQDTPGYHQELLASQGFEVVNKRGPLKEDVMLDLIEGFDGLICGDDQITRAVIEKGVNSKLKIISKYGIGLDKIDVNAVKEFNIPLTNCPGVNSISVAEHVFALLLCQVKNIIKQNDLIQNQDWTRLIGTELFGKTIGIIGLGNIGKELAKRAMAFGIHVIAFDKYIDSYFVSKNQIKIASSIEELIAISDIISFNLALNPETKGIINESNLSKCKKGVIMVNTARSGFISEELVMKGIDLGIIGAYLTDVLDEEPMVKEHPFLKYSNIIITPHIGSRTYESVVRQGTMAVENLLKHI